MQIGKFFFVTGTLVLLAACQNRGIQTPEDPWSKTDEIISQIRLPEIPERTLFLSDFGGIGDGITDNKSAFDSIIAFCTEQGGGKIVVDSGIYRVEGPVHLSSNINLHLEEGSKLVFGSDPESYLPMVLTSWEGTRCYNYSPFIYAIEADNVAITGKGEIDGESSDSFHHWKAIQDPDKQLLRKMNNEAIPVKERLFGEGHYLRPHLVQFYECENILVEGVKISDPPFWCLHFVFSKNITVRKLTYEAFNYNSDGIDPESSENVLIEDIIFNNRDDNIAIKAGRDLEARTLGRPSRNIVIRNCEFRGHNAIAIGSEMSGSVYDVYVEDCSFAGKVMYGFYLKGNRDRGGSVHDIYGRNIEFDSTRSSIIIDSNYKNEGSCCPPLFKNVRIENIRSTHASDHGIYLKGFEEMHLDSIYIGDIEIKSARIPVEVSHTDNLVMDRVTINGEDHSNVESK